MSRAPIVGDGAQADDPALDGVLRRAMALHPQSIDLSLDRLEALLAKLGDPHLSLPPVFHVAGTNGKGSVTAYLRACLEAVGHKVHAYTSPHLVNFNERIRLAGRLIADAPLTALLEEVMAANAGSAITFFELTTAAAFLAFARTPADALVLEVGLGGRFDATNVIRSPIMTGLTHISLDHQRFLGNDVTKIAFEKAGIAKPGVPLVTARYPSAMAHRVAAAASDAGAPLMPRGSNWDATFYQRHLHYRDEAGTLSLNPPRLRGAHQHDNAAIALAMLRHQDTLAVPESALKAGIGWAEWPARLQRLESGALAQLLPKGTALYLDGGHNPAAGRAIGGFLRRELPPGAGAHIILGMIEGKDAAGFLKALAHRASGLTAVPVSGHACQPPEAISAAAAAEGLTSGTAASVPDALRALASGPVPPIILICGSLYLAGEVLKANGTPPG